MKLVKSVWSGIALLVLTGLVWYGLKVFFDLRGNGLRQEHRVRAHAQTRQWAQEKTARQIAAHQARMARREQHRLELEAALGGPVEKVLKNPELNLTEFLRRLTEKVAPVESRVTVRAERFVEFIVNIELPRRATPLQIAEWSRTLLQHASTYVHVMRFSFRGDVLAELDRRGIESFADWSQAPLEEVVARLASLGATQEVPNPAAADTPVAEVAADTQERKLDAATERLRQVLENFNSLLQTQRRALLENLRQLDDVARISEVRSREDLRTREATVRAVKQQFASLREFLLNPGAVYRRMLTDAGADAVYVRASVRGVEQRNTASIQVERLFSALSSHCNAIGALLGAMEKSWGEWEAKPLQLQIAFYSDVARRAYENGSEELDRSARAVDAAMKAWTDAVQERK